MQKRVRSIGGLHVVATLAFCGIAFATAAQPRGPQPPRTARAAAQADLTGTWVAQITEDWRWRMITPPKGDYASVPLNAAGRQLADRWDAAADVAAGEQCRAFGAGGVMRLPTRVKISWADDETLKLTTDADALLDVADRAFAIAARRALKRQSRMNAHLEQAR